jgi:hypothetical protein
MDMAPPNPSPAVTRNAADDVATLISRMVENQRWVIDQTHFLPAVPADMAPSARAAFMEHLGAFWQAPRNKAFGTHWAALMADAARLGVADGDLSEQAAGGILAFTAAQGHLVPPHVEVRRLLVGTLPYAGAVVIVDSRDDASALLFTPERGWESFRGLVALHAEVEERLRETLANGASLRGLAEDGPVLTGDISVASRDIPGNALDVLVQDIVDVQRRRVIDAWSWRDHQDGWRLRLADRLHDALAPERYTDVIAMLDHREHGLFASNQESRLAQLPVMVRTLWEQALADFQHEVTDTRSVLTLGGVDTVASIDQFARAEVADRLRRRGISADPATITIELFKTTSNTAYGYSGTDMERRSLIALARENFGYLEMRGMQARTASGGLLTSLARDDIVDMIRAVDLRNSYQAYLVRQLKTSARGQHMRAASARLHQARMRFELADARADAFIEGETKSFIDDHAERGYHWVEAVLNSPEPAGRRRVERHDIVVSHVVYEGVRVKDVFVIGTRAADSVSRMILYTPDAPDGRSFREFADRQAATAQFLAHPVFEQYLLERLPIAFSTVDRDGATRRFRVSDGTRRAVWVLSGRSGERPYTLTEGRFTEEEITGNLFDASYDVALGQLGIEAADMARSTSEADYDHTRSIGMWSARLAEGFVPVRLGVAVAGARALHALWRGIENVARDERADAFEDFVDAFSSAADVTGSYTLARSFRKAIWARMPGSPGLLTRVQVKGPGIEAVFDARYVANNVRLKDASSVTDGVYQIGAKHYIEHRGQLYGVHFDTDNATWRLRKTQHATTDYAPPVSRDNTGLWRHNKDVGLRGGTFDRPDLFDREPAELLIEYRGLNPETASLSESDVRVLVQALARQGLRQGVTKRLIHDRTHNRPTSAVLARHWDAALDEARRPPLRIPTPPSPAASTFELVKLERSQWPGTVWHYTTPYRHDMFKGTALTLNQSLPSATGPSGLHVMTLDPGRSSREIVEVMRGKTRAYTFTDEKLRTIAGAYVEIDLNKLRNRQREDGTYEFNVYTVAHRSGLEFVIKPTLPAPHRDIAPLSPRRQRDLAGIALRPGEFRTGLRFP